MKACADVCVIPKVQKSDSKDETDNRRKEEIELQDVTGPSKLQIIHSKAAIPWIITLKVEIRRWQQSIALHAQFFHSLALTGILYLLSVAMITT